MDTPSAAATAKRPHPPFTPGKLGMWLFLGSDMMGFMGLIGGYMVLRLTSADWQRSATLDPSFGIRLTAFMTFILIVSSVTMVTALDRIQKGDRKGLLFWLGMTILGGATFLGLQVYEWTHFIDEIRHMAAAYTDANAGLEAPFTNYQATFFALTGFHGLHVTVGVIYLSCIWFASYRGRYSAQSNSPVELVGLYWHFVDLVWIVIFTIIYLIPDPVQ
jgi:heme/copper-type cytochrome/quinol oxidase subunit 3